MANREALRQLQGRLAERLQLARTEVRARSWLAVECAGQGLLIPLETAGEIFPLGTLVAVPHAKPWFLGVANLRGGLHGVVDMAAFLGLRAPMLRDAVRDQQQVLAFNPVLGAHCAIVVDRLAGLRNIGQLTGEPPDGQARPAFAGTVFRDADGRRWQEIDLAALVRNDQFLAIAA